MPSPTSPARRSAAASTSRAMEQRAAAPDAALLRDAEANFAALSFGQRLELARQLALARKAEFTRSITNVVTVGAGLKRRCGADGFDQIHPEPCVVFIVRRKLAPDAWRTASTQRLPKQLLTPALVNGVQLMCAVPTDVQRQERLLGARAQSDAGIFSVPATPGASDFGAACCIVRDDNGARYVIAPIHVLSPHPADDGRGIATKPAAVFRLATAQAPHDVKPFLKATRFGGRLVPGSQRSFDVQLATVLDEPRAALAFSGIALSATQPFAADLDALGELIADGTTLRILVPNNNPNRGGGFQPALRATLSLTQEDHPIDYFFGSNPTPTRVQHSTIELHIEPGATTLPGDSGCPVVVQADDGLVFIGMHIAGNPSAGTSHVIPAWDLLNGFRYSDVGGTLPGALTLVSPT